MEGTQQPQSLVPFLRSSLWGHPCLWVPGKGLLPGQRHLGQPAIRAAPFLALSRGGGLRKGRHPGHLAYFLGFQKEAPDGCHFPWHCFSFRSSSATHSSQRSAGDIQQQSLHPIPISCFWLSRQFCPCTSRGPEHPWPVAPSLPACLRKKLLYLRAVRPPAESWFLKIWPSFGAFGSHSEWMTRRFSFPRASHIK